MELLPLIQKISDVIIENKEYLTELDRVIGDGDHGVNLARGFEKISAELPQMQMMQPADILNKMSILLMSNVGGASGALYASALMKGAGYLKKQQCITAQTVAEVWGEMIKGIQMRGKAVAGEKTMLDAQIPAYQAFAAQIEQGSSVVAAFTAAEEKAKTALEATKQIVATKGRASYLGERSLGHLDPGAASSYLIIKTISETLNGVKN